MTVSALPYRGGERVVRAGLVCALLGAAGVAIGVLVDMRETAIAYLIAFTYAASIVVSGVWRFCSVATP